MKLTKKSEPINGSEGSTKKSYDTYMYAGVGIAIIAIGLFVYFKMPGKISKPE